MLPATCEWELNVCNETMQFIHSFVHSFYTNKQVAHKYECKCLWDECCSLWANTSFVVVVRYLVLYVILFCFDATIRTTDPFV